MSKRQTSSSHLLPASLAACCMVTMLASVGLADTSQANITALRNRVDMKLATTDWSIARIKTLLNPGASLRTGDDSAAELTYTDGTTKTATANASGAYSFSVSANWSGKVTPTKSGVPSFTPAYRTYTHITANQTNQNYKPNHLAAFTSIAAQDGYVV